MEQHRAFMKEKGASNCEGKILRILRFLDVHLSGLVHFFKIHEHLFLIYKGDHYVDMFDYVLKFYLGSKIFF